MYKPHHIFISPIYCVGQKEAKCGCLLMGLCISPYSGMGRTGRRALKSMIYFVNPNPKSFMLLGKLIVQEITFSSPSIKYSFVGIYDADWYICNVMCRHHS